MHNCGRTQVVNVMQGEAATAQPGHGPVALGSDSATTCHIVAFRNPSTGRVCLAHLDSSKRIAKAVDGMWERVSSTDRGGDSDALSDRSEAEDVTASSLKGDIYIYIFLIVQWCISCFLLSLFFFFFSTLLFG